MLPLASVSSTQKVMLGAMTSFLPELSDPALSRYTFVYSLQLNNVRPDALLLASCHIQTIDEQGQLRIDEHAQDPASDEVRLRPGGVLLFQGRVTLPTPTGNLWGHVELRFAETEPGQPERTVAITIAKVGAAANNVGLVPTIHPADFIFGWSETPQEEAPTASAG